VSAYAQEEGTVAARFAEAERLWKIGKAMEAYDILGKLLSASRQEAEQRRATIAAVCTRHYLSPGAYPGCYGSIRSPRQRCRRFMSYVQGHRGELPKSLERHVNGCTAKVMVEY
jgi:hypothetical protein